jgi:hypothetical protein
MNNQDINFLMFAIAFIVAVIFVATFILGYNCGKIKKHKQMIEDLKILFEKYYQEKENQQEIKSTFKYFIIDPNKSE